MAARACAAGLKMIDQRLATGQGFFSLSAELLMFIKLFADRLAQMQPSALAIGAGAHFRVEGKKPGIRFREAQAALRTSASG